MTRRFFDSTYTGLDTDNPHDQPLYLEASVFKGFKGSEIKSESGSHGPDRGAWWWWTLDLNCLWPSIQWQGQVILFLNLSGCGGCVGRMHGMFLVQWILVVNCHDSRALVALRLIHMWLCVAAWETGLQSSLWTLVKLNQHLSFWRSWCNSALIPFLNSIKLIAKSIPMQYLDCVLVILIHRPPCQVEDFLAGGDLMSEDLENLRFWAGALKMIPIIERPIEAWPTDSEDLHIKEK